MIKLFSSIVLVLFSVATKAQNTDSIPKKYLGINLAGMYTTNEISADRQTNLIINAAPFYGRRVKKIVFGIGAGIAYNFSKIPQSSYTNSATYFEIEKSLEIVLLPTLRYYTKHNIFFSGVFNIGRGKGESSAPNINARNVNYYNADYKSKIIGGALGIGYAIKAGKSFLIEPQISVQKIYNELNYNVYTTSYSVYNTNYDFKINRDYWNLLIGLGTIYRF